MSTCLIFSANMAQGGGAQGVRAGWMDPRDRDDPLSFYPNADRLYSVFGYCEDSIEVSKGHNYLIMKYLKDM